MIHWNDYPTYRICGVRVADKNRHTDGSPEAWPCGERVPMRGAEKMATTCSQCVTCLHCLEAFMDRLIARRAELEAAKNA